MTGVDGHALKIGDSWCKMMWGEEGEKTFALLLLRLGNLRGYLGLGKDVRRDCMKAVSSHSIGIELYDMTTTYCRGCLVLFGGCYAASIIHHPQYSRPCKQTVSKELIRWIQIFLYAMAKIPWNFLSQRMLVLTPLDRAAKSPELCLQFLGPPTPDSL